MKKSVQPRAWLVMATVGTVFTLSDAMAQQTQTGGDAVIAWNANAGVAAMKACISPTDDPMHESRIYAMMHIAIHDALNAIDRRFRPYTYNKGAAPGASPQAAIAAAAHNVLVPLLRQLPTELVAQSCIDAGVASAETDYTAALPPRRRESRSAKPRRPRFLPCEPRTAPLDRF
jgi:hypothetical protein